MSARATGLARGWRAISTGVTNKAWFCVALLAACRTPARTEIREPELGRSTKGQGTGEPAAAKRAVVDPNLGFRIQYANPGGMWMPMQMTLKAHVDNFKKMGAMEATALADPLKEPLAAIVSLGGCTGSFVSADGLVVTNHHCVQGALQNNSTETENLVEHGFLAKTRVDEKSAGPTQKVMVVQSYKDVSHEMRDGLEAIKDPIKRKEEMEARLKQQIAACEKGRPWLRCNVSSFFRGDMYQLIEMLEIKDVRLVYVPARSVGNYGGEIDNWAWPRHTGDFSFYRAYVGKDGKPADYSPDNVPYHPAHWLKVTTAGLKPGDFVMVTGYPGSTSRTRTAAEIHHDVEWFIPYYTAYVQERYKIAEQGVASPDKLTVVKATTMKQGVQNSLEKNEGVLAGLTKGDLLAQKDELDKKVRAWAAQPGHEAHAAAIAKLDQLLADEFRTSRVDFDRGVAFGGSRLLGTAMGFTRWAEERAKANEARKPGYQDRDMPRAIAGQKGFVKSYDRSLDRAGFRLALVRALQIDEKDRPWLALLLDAKKGAKIDEALIDKTLDAWYQATTLEDDKVRLELLQTGTTKQLQVSKDAFVKAAQRIWPTYKAEEKKTDARAGEMMLVTPFYADAMRQVLGGVLAPDANGTLRITYGTVRSLKPDSKDAGDSPFTVASQLLAMDTGTAPYDAPKVQLDAIKAKKFGPYADPTLGGDLPLDFLTDLDITGGNSGSPTLNGKGELVGLAFDGNKEGVASDVVFNPGPTRSIHVDARYMIWQMDAIDGADRLIREMGLTPSL